MTAKIWNRTRQSGGRDGVWDFSQRPCPGSCYPISVSDCKSVACHVLCSLQLDQIGSMSPVPTPETNSCSVMKLANGPDGLVA